MSEINTQRGPADPARGAIESRDIDPARARQMLLGLGGVLALVAAAAAVLLLLFGGLRDRAVPASRPTAIPLQIDERADRARIDAHGAERLAGRDGGIPIDQAMRRTAAAGWDVP